MDALIASLIVLAIPIAVGLLITALIFRWIFRIDEIVRQLARIARGIEYGNELQKQRFEELDRRAKRVVKK